jgi:hypothetical protein
VCVWPCIGCSRWSRAASASRFLDRADVTTCWTEAVGGVRQGGDEEGIRTVFATMEHNGAFLNKLLKGSRKKPGLQVRWHGASGRQDGRLWQNPRSR